MSQQNRTEPRAFLSHSSKDKAVAERIATELRAAGVDCWFDEWEISLGDSITRKIEEGLNWDVFLVLLSHASTTSRWVAEELDAALIRRIEQKCRIIPIRLDDCEVPNLLKALKRSDFNGDLQSLVQELSRTIFGVTERPPMGAPPRCIPFDERQIRSLSLEASRVARCLVRRAMDAASDTNSMEGHEIAANTGMSAGQVNDAIGELSDLRFVQLRQTCGTAPFDFHEATAGYALFLTLEPSELGYDPNSDILEVTVAIVARESLSGARLQQETSLPTARLNRAAQFLIERGLVEHVDYIGGFPFDFGDLEVTHRTRRFLQDMSGTS